MARVAALHFLVVLVLADALFGSPPRRVESLPSTFRVRDEATAKKFAEDYFTSKASKWVQGVKPYRADHVFYTCSPENDGAMLKRGDPIWVVDIVNDMQSYTRRCAIAILWVRAEDGAIFLSSPKT